MGNPFFRLTDQRYKFFFNKYASLSYKSLYLQAQKWIK